MCNNCSAFACYSRQHNPIRLGTTSCMHNLQHGDSLHPERAAVEGLPSRALRLPRFGHDGVSLLVLESLGMPHHLR